MMNKGNLYTKQILAASFIDLLKYNPLSKITIQRIVDNCEFTRQTFYLHFKDKYDLINWIYKQKNYIITFSYLDKISWKDILCKLLEYHKSNKKFYRAIMEYSGQNSVREYLRMYTYDTYCVIINKQINNVLLPDEFMFSLRLYSCGSAQMTLDWILNDMKESPQYIATRLYNSMNTEIKNYFP